jgi:hypothetical protein
MNKKGFIDADTFQNPGFWILTALGWSATLVGWKMSQGFDGGALPGWQIAIILVVIALAAAFFSRD